MGARQDTKGLRLLKHLDHRRRGQYDRPTTHQHLSGVTNPFYGMVGFPIHSYGKNQLTQAMTTISSAHVEV